jgi:nicotinamidase-related amidase
MTGLLIVDAQNGLFERTERPAQVLNAIRHVLESARTAGKPVFYTQDVDVGARGSDARAIHPHLEPRQVDLVLEKGAADAFHGTRLDAALRARGVTTLVLCGLQTPACVFATAVGAVYRGFNVVLVADGHGTNSAGGFQAQTLVDCTNALLDGFGSVHHGFDAAHASLSVAPSSEVSFGDR